jgi:hypothetical protein
MATTQSTHIEPEIKPHSNKSVVFTTSPQPLDNLQPIEHKLIAMPQYL